MQQIKLIDKTLSGILTGSNINMAESNQELISNTINQASSFPIGSNTYSQTQHNTIPGTSKKIEKIIQKEDPLGNKLWRSDGTP